MRRTYGYGLAVLVIVIGLVATLGAQPPAGAQGGRGQGMGSGMGQGMRGQGMGPGGAPMADLKLTTEQQHQIQEIMQAHRDENQAAMQRARDLRKQLRGLVFGGNGDEAAALALATEIAAVEAKTRITMQLAVAAVLTPEQRKIVIEKGIDFPPGPMGPGGPGGRGKGRGN